MLTLSFFYFRKTLPDVRSFETMSRIICRKTDFLECHVSVFLWRTFLPLFFIVGVPGNVLSLVVLSRKRMRNTTTSVYLRLLAIVDTLVILTSASRDVAWYFGYIKVKDMSEFACKFYLYMNPNCIALSWCLLPIITIDRFIHVRYPIWAKDHCTRKTSVVTFLVLSFIIFAIHVHRLAFFSVHEVRVSPNSTKVNYICGPKTEWYVHFKDKVWPPIFSALFSVTPVVCQLVCNILLVRELSIRSKQNKARKVLEAGHKKEQRELRSITRMLLVVCVFFILSSVPHCLNAVLKGHIFDKRSPHDVAKRLLVTSLTSILMYTNNSINFLLYTVSGRIFRNEFYLILQNVRYQILKRLGRSVHPVETNSVTEFPEGTSQVQSVRLSSTVTDTKTAEGHRFQRF